MTTTKTPAQVLTSDQARELAADLLRELEPIAGDRAAVRAVLLRWLDVLDVGGLSMVCMAAVFTTFTECMTRTPLDQIPPGAIAFSQGETHP